MAGKTDKVKGRVKEAAGTLTNDKTLKREGKIDQVAGAFKEAVEGMVDTVKKAVTGQGSSRARRTIHH